MVTKADAIPAAEDERSGKHDTGVKGRRAFEVFLRKMAKLEAKQKG
jgi:hypothetical protein